MLVTAIFEILNSDTYSFTVYKKIYVFFNTKTNNVA